MSDEKEIVEVNITINVRVGDSDRGRDWIEGLVNSIVRAVGKKNLKKPPNVERLKVRRAPVN
jgi:hypothetical protein